MQNMFFLFFFKRVKVLRKSGLILHLYYHTPNWFNLFLKIDFILYFYSIKHVFFKDFVNVLRIINKKLYYLSYKLTWFVSSTIHEKFTYHVSYAFQIFNFKPEVMNDVNKAYAFDSHSATLDSYAEPHFKYSFFFFLRWKYA